MLKLQPHLSPVQYKFQDPDTKREFAARDRQTLIASIITYRRQNNLEPIEELHTVLENYLCTLPENAGRCQDVKLGRGFFEYLRGGVALLENIFFSSFVTQEVAEERAAICKDCPLNVFPDRDEFIVWTDRIAEASTGGKTTSLDAKLGNCEACTCPLRAKVHFGGQVRLKTSEINTMKQKGNKYCWQLKEVTK